MAEQQIIDMNAQERISACYKIPAQMRKLWVHDDLFSESFSSAIEIYYSNEGNEEKKNEAFYFIEYTCVFLIRRPADIIGLVAMAKNKENVDLFLDYFVKHRFVDDEIVGAMISSHKFLSVFRDCHGWVDWPMRMYAKKVMDREEKEKFDIIDLVPAGINTDRMTSEYILSWAYEEGRLTDDATQVFELEFPKKFNMLNQIMKR